MKKILIVDDEEDARSLLRFYISQHEALSIVGEATNGLEAVQRIKELQPDTVFLDIQMPGLNGFEVLTHLDEIPEIVFSTAFDQYALKAFEVHALDYLLKPYGKVRFENALSRILKNQEGLVSLTEALLKKEGAYPERIILHKGNRKIMVAVNDILYAEAFGDYTKVFTAQQEFLSVRGISQVLEGLNPDLFIRLHRSYFVNKNKLLEIKKTERYYYALLSNSLMLKISDSYLPAIKKILF